MRLLSIKYSEYEGESQEWSLDALTLGAKNLIVGRNSTGKSRTLNVIGGLARILSKAIPTPPSGSYHAEWAGPDGKKYKYETTIRDSVILSESLCIDGIPLLQRGEGGFGKIFAEKIGNGLLIEFQAPPNEFALVKRRDAVQHSFIEPIYQWAAAVRHYQFGSSLGKEQLALVVPDAPAVNDRDQRQVVGVFRAGIKEFPDRFASCIIEDMRSVGYTLEDIYVGAPIGITVQGAPGELASIVVKEAGLPGRVDQITMSQGMYRVLALLVHVNYLQLKGTSTCVIIDDIGEGLDYERSCKLINLLRQKADESGLQIIMSTNDRFVMNEVPLEEWTVLCRSGSRVSARNYENSKDKFDDFKFTGLSNFSFFEMDFLNSEDDGATY